MRYYVRRRTKNPIFPLRDSLREVSYEEYIELRLAGMATNTGVYGPMTEPGFDYGTFTIIWDGE